MKATEPDTGYSCGTRFCQLTERKENQANNWIPVRSAQASKQPENNRFLKFKKNSSLEGNESKGRICVYLSTQMIAVLTIVH
jgi:hypothetical protein